MLLQEWVNENNYIPSMSKFLTLDDSGQSLNNLFSQYSGTMETFGTLVKDFLKVNKKKVDKLDNDINKLGDHSDEMEPGDGGDGDNLEQVEDVTQKTDEEANPEDIAEGTDVKEGDKPEETEEKPDDKKEEDENFEFDLDEK